MIHYTKENIAALSKLPRINLINSITGYKPGNMIGTINKDGMTNLAVISSVIHLGSDPALIGFIMRPLVGERHTYENIIATGVYTINHIHSSIIERAHFTSADFKREESEFDMCALTPVYKEDFMAPYVAESQVQIGMSLADVIPITLNNTILIIGQVEHIYVAPNGITADQSVDLNALSTVCISGLDNYHIAQSIGQFPYARVSNIPDFK